MKRPAFISRFFSKKKQKPYKIGIALGGGGARGFVHFGVIQALKEKGIVPEIISGSSAGALAGVFIASGTPPRRANEILQSKDLLGYTKVQWPKEGFFSLKGLSDLLRKEIQHVKLEELPTPLIIATTNLNKGKIEYLNEGNLIQAVVASSSIPVLFKPVTIGENKYVDGGVMDNLPAKPLFPLCEKVIGISISPIEETSDLGNIPKIATRTFQLGINAQNHNVSKQCDLFIRPEGLRDYDLFGIKKVDELFELGYQHIMNTDLSVLKN